MIDETPVPNDSFGSLFEFAGWMYPRAWAGFASIFAVTLLPAEILSIAASRVLGFGTPAGMAAAVRSGAFARIGLLLASKSAFFLVLLYHHWSCMAMGDALARGGDESVGGAMRVALARLPAQLWTLFNIMARLSPIAFLGGITAAITFRESPLTAVFVLVIVAVPYVYFTLRWVLSSAVTLFEGISGGDALRRSSILCGARFWLFSFQFTAYTLAGSVPAVVLALAAGRYLPAWAAGFPGIVIGGLLIGPFTTGMFLALYRREASRSAAAETAPA